MLVIEKCVSKVHEFLRSLRRLKYARHWRTQTNAANVNADALR